jgi:hypothetical protein
VSESSGGATWGTQIRAGAAAGGGSGRSLGAGDQLPGS